MPKTPKKSKSPSPEWARLVRELRQELGFNQAELGAETALFGNGYPGGNVEGKSLPIGPTSNSGTSSETASCLLGRRRYWGDSVSELFGFGLEALDL